jgi:predicted nucleic acid-binding Zn ribbon protein
MSTATTNQHSTTNSRLTLTGLSDELVRQAKSKAAALGLSVSEWAAQVFSAALSGGLKK